MDIPSTAFEVGVLIAGLLPGVVFAAVRTWLRGYSWADQAPFARVTNAIVVSVLLDSVYLLGAGAVLVPFLRDPTSEAVKHPELTGVAIFLGVAAVPTLIALAMHFRPVWRVPSWNWWPAKLKLPHRATAFESTPTAWDKAAPGMAGKWVRVLLPNGRRVAGWMSGRSFLSSYPQPRDIYIQEQFEVDERGVIGARVPNTAGVWLAIPDGCIVEWLEDKPTGSE